MVKNNKSKLNFTVTIKFSRADWLVAIVYLTIIPRARVGYEMISNKREWNNCFIENNQEMLLDHADFALQEQAEGNLMVAFS